MRIVIKQKGLAGDQEVFPGEYWVSVRSDTRQVCLAGKGSDIMIPAIRRKAKSKVRVQDVQFYTMGGPTWTIAVKTPPDAEWVAHITYGKQKKKK